MKYHYCPDEIKALFATEAMASGAGRRKFLEWFAELRDTGEITPGDLVEMPIRPGVIEWPVYLPSCGKVNNG